MLLTADQHRRLADIFEEAAAAQKAARFRALARMAEQKAKDRRLN
jgi:hypothetical protein